jgi:hypothetical protein
MKNGVFWDVTPCGSCENRRFVGSIASIIKVTIIDELGTLALTSSPIIFTLMMKAIHSSGTSVLTGATRRHIAEDGILHNHRHENIKSYITLTGWTM